MKEIYKNIENDRKLVFWTVHKNWRNLRNASNSAAKGLIPRCIFHLSSHCELRRSSALYRFLFSGVTGRCYFAVRLNTPESARWEEPPAACCRLPGYLPSSLEARLRPRIHHRGPPPVTYDVSRLTRRPRPAAPSYAYRNSNATVIASSARLSLALSHLARD